MLWENLAVWHKLNQHLWLLLKHFRNVNLKDEFEQDLLSKLGIRTHSVPKPIVLFRNSWWTILVKNCWKNIRNIFKNEPEEQNWIIFCVKIGQYNKHWNKIEKLVWKLPILILSSWEHFRPMFTSLIKLWKTFYNSTGTQLTKCDNSVHK